MGSPGSRAWSFPSCLGSQTARSPRGACDIASFDVAFRLVEQRRRSESQLNTVPVGAPVNASMAPSRLTTHDSGSGWLDKPSLFDSFIHYYPTPGHPGALNKSVTFYR
jgi:hypothetical protein